MRKLIAGVAALIALTGCGIDAKKQEESSVRHGTVSDIGDFRGIPMPAVNLFSEEGQNFAVRGNKMFMGRPDGFYRLIFPKIETVLFGTDRDEDISVVYTSHCQNYNGDPYTAYTSCKAKYDPMYDRSVAKLSKENCSSNDSESHVDYHMFLYKGIYKSARTGYYHGNRCTIKVSVVKDGKWLVDPISQSNDFTPNFDISYSEEADLYRQPR